MALLFALSSLPGKRIPSPFPYSDKAMHVLAYAVLGALLELRNGFSRKFSGERPAEWAAGDGWAPLLGALYGVTDEFHQRFVPGRIPGFDDVAADTAGALLGWWLARRWDGRRRSQGDQGSPSGAKRA